MPRDAQPKYTKKETKHSKKQEELNKKKKRNHDSDDDDNSIFTSDDEDEMDVHEYRKFLKKIFPSKHLDKKVEAGNRLKAKAAAQAKKYLSEADSDSDYAEEVVKKPKKKTKATKKRQVESESESEEEDDDEDEDEDEDDDDEIKKPSKFNIIFTIGGKEHDDEWETDEDGEWETDDDDEETEDENVSVSSDDDEDEEEDEDEEADEEEEPPKKSKKAKKSKDEKTETPSESAINDNPEDVLVQLKELYEKNKSQTTLDCIKMCEDKISQNKAKQQKKCQKQKEKNGRIFKKIIRDKNTMNDTSFFEKMEISQQKKVLGELREINKTIRIEKPYRMSLLESNIPVQFKADAIKKINSLRYMEPGSGEYYKIQNWVSTFMRIPFGKIENLPVNITHGVEACHDFMENAKKTLDEAVYGLNDAKMQIMQMMGQLITNPNAIGTAIAIQGPPGTGKTSLVKEGISKILNRPFAFIALGGATDSSFLEGHSYTYEGSTWGKIVQILINSKVMNPVIYFDELDKISDTPKGEEIAGILTHLTDTTQNSQFHDKYFAEIDFDLSKCLFIFSYNDESKINPILRDRMYKIHTKGYDRKQKTIISNQYLMPKIREQVKFDEGQIIIPDETIGYIIENHCNKEDGVRNMKRCFEIIHTKLNLYRLMKPGSNLFEEDMSLKVEFPFTVTPAIVDKLIKKPEVNMSYQSMYM
jgi:ATP-dependent Lon protease